LDQFVRVEVIEAQLVRHQPPDGRFAGAHKTNERKIDDAAVTVHGNRVAQASRLRNSNHRHDARAIFPELDTVAGNA
jgi:hypothetical protein